MIHHGATRVDWHGRQDPFQLGAASLGAARILAGRRHDNAMVTTAGDARIRTIRSGIMVEDTTTPILRRGPTCDATVAQDTRCQRG